MPAFSANRLSCTDSIVDDVCHTFFSNKEFIKVITNNLWGAMDNSDTHAAKKKRMYILFFNVAVMISSFVIALIALPYEMFFVVAVIILFALRDIEKDITKFGTKHSPTLTNMK